MDVATPESSIDLDLAAAELVALDSLGPVGDREAALRTLAEGLLQEPGATRDRLLRHGPSHLVPGPRATSVNIRMPDDVAARLRRWVGRSDPGILLRVAILERAAGRLPLRVDGATSLVPPRSVPVRRPAVERPQLHPASHGLRSLQQPMPSPVQRKDSPPTAPTALVAPGAAVEPLVARASPLRVRVATAEATQGFLFRMARRPESFTLVPGFGWPANHELTDCLRHAESGPQPPIILGARRDGDDVLLPGVFAADEALGSLSEVVERAKRRWRGEAVAHTVIDPDDDLSRVVIVEVRITLAE